MPSIGVDSSPVAVSLAQAKLVNASVNDIVRTAADVLDDVPHPSSVPGGEFWERAFHPDVLQTVCRLREGLLSDCKSDGRRALRAILLGALHGPRNKHGSSYFSNQSPRTFAPKPRYAVKFWRERNLAPPFVNVLQIIEQRAHRYYGQEQTRGRGVAVLGDSRECEVFRQFHEHARVRGVITSPPYYGMRTYIPDQWLRSWFVGGTSV
ncbi:MAG: DNA modification methylase, partial [Dehalococcoidia bacterium]